MKRFWMMLPLAGLMAGLSFTTLASAQPPEQSQPPAEPGERRGPPPPGERGDRRGPPDARPGGPGGPPRGEGRPGPGGPGGPGRPMGPMGPMGDRRGGPPERGERREAPKPDAAVESWVKMLSERIADPHDVVRESSRAGLIAVGPAALPVLEQIAKGDDNARATAARRVMEAIERSPRPGFAFGGPPPMGMPFGPFRGGAPFMRGRDGDRPGPGPRREGRPDGPPERGDRDRPEARPEGRGEGRPGFPGRRPDGPPGERPDRPEGRGEGRPGFPGRGPGGSPIEAALGELKLNEKQAQQAQQIRQGFEEKMRDLMMKVREENADPAEVRQQFGKFREEMMADFKELLTAEQFEKLQDAMRRNAPPGGPLGEGRPGRRPDGPPGEGRPGRPPQE